MKAWMGLILGVLSRKHNVPFFLYPGRPSSQLIGNPKTICSFRGIKTAPARIRGYVPLAEVVGQKYITKIYSRN